MKRNLTRRKRQKSHLLRIVAAISVVLIILLTSQLSKDDIQLMPNYSAKNTSEIAQKVENLLSKMTLAEKVGQMTQITLEVVSKTEAKLYQKYQVNPKKLRKAITKYHIGSILNLTLPKAQLELASAIAKTGTPIVLVLV